MLQKIFNEIISNYYFIDNETLLIYRRGHNKFLQNRGRERYEVFSFVYESPLIVYIFN